ncbi:hypothetical protein NKH77_53970 [Streptomyces sp. M19]
MRGPYAAVDRATADFGRWRDRTYAEYYGLAADLGVAGPIAAAVPEVVRKLHAQGRVSRVLDLLSHRASVLDVLTPARVLGATGRLLARGGALGRGPRRPAARGGRPGRRRGAPPQGDVAAGAGRPARAAARARHVRRRTRRGGGHRVDEHRREAV